MLAGGWLFTFCGVFGGVWFFSHLHLGVVGGAVVTRRFFFLRGVGVGVGEARGFVLVSDSLVPA